MSEQRYNCTEIYPSPPGTPFYNQCWGFRELPTSLNFEVSGFRNVLPGADCQYLNSPTLTGQMTRTSPCEFTYAWSNGTFGIILAMNNNRPPLSTKINQESYDLTNWYVGGSLVEKGKASYCRMTDPPLGKVTFEIAGRIGNDVCEADFRIWVEENG